MFKTFQGLTNLNSFVSAKNCQILTKSLIYQINRKPILYSYSFPRNKHIQARIKHHSKTELSLNLNICRNLCSSSKLLNIPTLTKKNQFQNIIKNSNINSNSNKELISLKDINKELLQTKITLRQNLYQRLKSKLKWILIRNKERPFSKDELETLFSWIIVSQIFWLILKTTTVISLLLWGFNTIFAKELVAQTIGKILNHYIDDIDIKFEDALIPEWQNGFIKFNNVKLKTENTQSNRQFQFNLTFHQVEINLSLKKWLMGKGLINDMKILGMNGEIMMKTFIDYEMKQLKTNDRVNSKYPDVKETENLLINWFTNPNYQLNNIVIVDSKINFTEFDKNDKNNVNNKTFMNYDIAIFNLEIPKLGFNHMIKDFLNAKIITGSINNSMFTFHKRQQKDGYEILQKDKDLWNRITRLRINSITVKDLGLHGTSSFNWIDEANIDIVADIMLPKEDENDDFLTSFLNKDEQKNNNHENGNFVDEIENDKYMVIDLKFILKDLKVSIPNESPRLSNGEQIISLNELKPVISYINLQKALLRAQNKSNSTDLEDNNHSYFVGDSAPNISIRRRKSYPNITIIQSNSKSCNNDNQESTNNDNKNTDTLKDNTSIIRFHNNVKNNEIVLHCRIVENMKKLDNKILFQETGVYDKLCMELYVDLLKIVEEWEYRNRDDWVKQWGNGFTSQLLLSGFASPI